MELHVHNYKLNRATVHRVHTGSLLQAVRSEFENASIDEQIARSWWAYEGDDVDAFVAYSRVSRILNEFVVSDISGLGVRRGRIPPLCDALEMVAGGVNFGVKWESVVNPELKAHLVRRGYEVAGASMSGTLVWRPEGPPRP